MSNKDTYNEVIVPQLMKDLGIKNKLALPKLKKVVINVGIGANKTNPKLTEMVMANLTAITGQKPVIRKARKAISGFKVRTGDEVGLMVTLRGQRMYDFVQKVAHVTLPRLRDFRGLDPKSFDQAGNLTLGFKEQLIFPEIINEKTEVVHGLEMTMIINSNNVENSTKLLVALGFPFKKIETVKEKNG